MIWQDIVIAIGGWILAAALIPTVLGKEKPALSSSVLTGSILAVFSVSYATLEFWNAALSTGVLAFIWFILAYQQWSRSRAEKVLESEHGR